MSWERIVKVTKKFKESAAFMTGPSKFGILAMYRVLEKTAKISRIHSNFQLPI
jgi:hypothetical protein